MFAPSRDSEADGAMHPDSLARGAIKPPAATDLSNGVVYLLFKSLVYGN
jgi:hypothetical protein